MTCSLKPPKDRVPTSTFRLCLLMALTGLLLLYSLPLRTERQAERPAASGGQAAGPMSYSLKEKPDRSGSFRSGTETFGIVRSGSQATTAAQSM